MDKTSNLEQNPPLQQAAVKCRFFAQYWGVKCMYVGGVGLVEIGTGGWNLRHPDFFLELKPLSKLTDKDAIEVSKIWGSKVESKILGNIISIRIGTKGESEVRNSIGVIDFLRSKGYALPFMEYSIEDLVSFGWVRLV
jgi:hypothetical protein